MSGLCALGHRGGSNGCFVLNRKANPGGADHIGQYMQLTDGKQVHTCGLLSTNILQILSDLPFRIGVRVRVTVTAKVLPGHRGTNFLWCSCWTHFLLNRLNTRLDPRHAWSILEISIIIKHPG